MSACLIHQFWWDTVGIAVPRWLCPSSPICLGVGQFGSGSALGHQLVVGIRSISLCDVCGSVLTPLLIGLGTPSTLCVGCISQDRMGMRSFTGLPNKHMARDIFVVGLGVFRNWRITAWRSLKETISPIIASDQPFDGYDPHLSSAVAVWECQGPQAVVYSPSV